MLNCFTVKSLLPVPFICIKVAPRDLIQNRGLIMLNTEEANMKHSHCFCPQWNNPTLPSSFLLSSVVFSHVLHFFQLQNFTATIFFFLYPCHLSQLCTRFYLQAAYSIFLLPWIFCFSNNLMCWPLSVV